MWCKKRFLCGGALLGVVLCALTPDRIAVRASEMNYNFDGMSEDQIMEYLREQGLLDGVSEEQQQELRREIREEKAGGGSNEKPSESEYYDSSGSDGSSSESKYYPSGSDGSSAGSKYYSPGSTGGGSDEKPADPSSSSNGDTYSDEKPSESKYYDSSYSTSSDGREKKASESDFYSSDGTNPLEGDEKLSESTFNPSSGVEFVEGDEKPADPEFSFSEDDRGDEKPSEEEFDRDYAPLDEEEGEVSFEDAAAAESDPKYDIRRYPEYRKAQAVLDKVDSLSKKIEKANDSLASLALEIEEKDAEIRRTEEEIDLMEKSLELVRREAQTIRHFLDTFIQYLYESRTDLGLAASLLRSGSFADFLNREHFVSLISRAFWDRLEEYERLEALIEMRTRELEELAQQQNRKKQELDASQERFREQIGRLSAQLARAEKKADSAQSAAQRLAEYLSSLEELENQVLEDTDPSLLGDSSDWSESIVSDGKEFWTSDKDYPYSESELVLMAGIIQAEAGNQPYEGKIAVGSVVMNRVESERFPNTIAGVIYSPNQFTPAGSGRLAVILAEGPTAECMQAARDVLGGRRNVNNLYFKSADYAASHGITGIKIADQVFH